MLDPLMISSKLQALEKISSGLSPEVHQTFQTFSEKMNGQSIQIETVRDFVDNQISSEIMREQIKQSLLVLEASLKERGLTLQDLLERHITRLDAEVDLNNTQRNDT